MKTWKTESGVRKAVRAHGLDGMNWEARSAGNRFTAFFFCALSEDVQELRDRGFLAELNPDKAA